MANANYAASGRSAFHRRIQAVTNGVGLGFKTIDDRLETDFGRLAKHLDAGFKNIVDAVNRKSSADNQIVLILQVRINVIFSIDRRQWISIDANEPIRDAWALMNRHAVKCLLVTDAGGGYVGLCTRSCVLAAAGERKWANGKVHQYMVPQAAFIGLDADAKVGEALDEFARHPVGRLVLRDDKGAPVGLLTMDQLLRWIAHQLKQASLAQST